MARHHVACAAGIAAVEMSIRDRLVEQVARLKDVFVDALHRHLGDLSIVGDIRGLEFLGGVAGELVVENRALVHGNATRIVDAGQEVAERVWAASGLPHVGEDLEAMT